MNFRKILCCTLASIMTFSACAPALAEDAALQEPAQAELFAVTTATIGGVTYELDSVALTATAKSIASAGATVSIPATVSSYPVVAIADDFCVENATVTTVDLTNASNLTSIGDNAFSYCKNLKTVKFKTSSSALSEIGDNAFYYCPALDTLSGIENQTNLLKVGASAFGLTPYMTAQSGEFVMLANVLVKYNGTATDVVVPNGTVAISDAFFGKDIKSINLKNAEYIGNNAFYGCRSLAEITIPAACKEIGDMAFSGCTSLTKVTYMGGLEKIGFNAFSGCTALSEFVNGADTASVLTDVGECAFWNCKALSVLELGNITTVNVGSFWNCFGDASDELYHYRVPTSVKIIDEGGFGNISFTYVTLPETVETIAPSAFGNSVDTTYVTVKGSVADTYFQNGNFEAVNYGDMNLDGTISASDIKAVENYIATGNNEDMNADSGKAVIADSNGDNRITLFDVFNIFKSIKEAYEAEQATK